MHFGRQTFLFVWTQWLLFTLQFFIQCISNILLLTTNSQFFRKNSGSDPTAPNSSSVVFLYVRCSWTVSSEFFYYSWLSQLLVMIDSVQSLPQCAVYDFYTVFLNFLCLPLFIGGMPGSAQFNGQPLTDDRLGLFTFSQCGFYHLPMINCGFQTVLKFLVF